MYHNVLILCFMMFASCATSGVAASATARPPIAKGIGDNSAEIGDDAAGTVDIAAKCKRDPMLNSVLNGEWSNYVAGRQIPQGSDRLSRRDWQ